jgi:hypothetical protein
MGTPAVVQFALSEVSLSATLNGTVAGNTIVVFCANQNGSAVTFNTPSDGVNTYVKATAASITGSDSNSVNSQISTYYCLSCVGGNITVSFTLASGTGSNDSIYVFEISGVTAYDTGGAALGNTANATCGPVTVHNANSITVVLCAHAVNTGTAGPGMTYIENTPGYNWSLEKGIFQATSVTPQVTNASDTFHTWCIVAPFFYAPAAAPVCTITILY